MRGGSRKLQIEFLVTKDGERKPGCDTQQVSKSPRHEENSSTYGIGLYLIS